MTDAQLYKIDVLVAERVMGPGYATEDEEHVLRVNEIYGKKYCPSRDDAQAAMVRRAMHEKGHVVELDRFFDVARPYARTGRVCRCRFPTMNDQPEGRADTESLATCIAALRAVGVEDEEWSVQENENKCSGKTKQGEVK